MNAGPEVTAEVARVVTESDTANQWGDVFPPAASTPFVLGLAEIACHGAVAKSLDAGQITVGTAAHIEHRRPSRVGATLVARAALTSRAGARLEFVVDVFDGDCCVAHVVQARAVVERDKILRRLNQSGPDQG